MSNKPTKRKADKDLGPRSRKRKRQLILSPRNVQPVLSDTSTIPMEITDRDEQTLNVSPIGGVTIEDETLLEMAEDGLLESGSGSEESVLEDDELGRKPTDPMRHDMPIVTSRWQEDEVDALMVALNVNRDAIKFHFDGPGGGRDVKRQGWRDVAAYVNSVANTHRTVQQCVNKTNDYTQRVKGKYNKLRYAISQTGKGKIKKTLKLKDTKGKALDYLREEAVKGIPGISPMPIGGPKTPKPSKKNRALVWEADRATKPEYSEVKMERQGVPKNYKQKNNRRVAREAKAERKKEYTKLMKQERKQERKEADRIAAENKETRQREEDVNRRKKTVQRKVVRKDGNKKKKEKDRKQKEQVDEKKERAEKEKKRKEKAERKEARRVRREERKIKRKAKMARHEARQKRKEKEKVHFKSVKHVDPNVKL